ncbi:hypothetical protein C1I98_04505 [Spongiactinospora gelatinilytica]|uniref:Uncharacterized protein n=1 Tax=Spongiactinospora gelatinilytica TaxID=2666298 RepID=A0A2W2GX46_9ACTN|nr:hypothetical protein [Spongiactinospora gelatinilytica]PZG54266.1 hypothetical protein C1I98_04505 [Spongiactinospora gelatinilytica]
MTWIFAGVGVAFAGVAVIAVLAVRVLAAAEKLHRELDRTRAQLTPKQDILRQKIDALRHPE